VYFFAIFEGAAGQDTLAYLIAIIGSFVVIFGYHWACEAFWSGQTIGKKVFRLRAVGDRGEPMTFFQAGIRNIVRIVDFLPYAYRGRRPGLPPALRAQLAGSVQAHLRQAAPDVFNQYGPLAALDHLADLENQ